MQKCFVILAMALSGGLVISVKPAPACTCAAPPGPAAALKRSSAVFRGRVSEISRPFWDRLGLTNTGGHHVKFAVVKKWKGSTSNTMEVLTRLSGEACGFPFELNKEYLVYVVTEPMDIQTGICTGTKNIADAEHEMKQLDEIVGGGAR
jgi:hypothetical protein